MPSIIPGAFRVPLLLSLCVALLAILLLAAVNRGGNAHTQPRLLPLPHSGACARGPG